MNKEIYRSYHLPGGTNIHRVKTNAIFVARNNTVRHELTKCLAAIMVARFGDVFFNSEIIYYLNMIDENLAAQDLTNDPHDFITEAVPNKKNPNEKKDRRVDLVDIDSGVRYEVETNHKIDKKDVDAQMGETVISIYI